MGCHCILVPVDGSESSSKAAAYAMELAQSCEAEINFLHVVDLQNSLANPLLAEVPRKDASVLEDVIDRGKRILDTLLEQVPLAINARGHCVSSSSPVEAILQEARDIGCDLIVMGSRGLGPWLAVLVGSVSRAVLEAAKCPVLLVKADKK